MIVPQSGQPIAKPEPRKKSKARKDREDATQLKAMREVVWLRDRGICRACHAWVRPPDAEYSFRCGHVHHRRGRNVAPEDRYNPDAALLLCVTCHRRAHAGEITV